MDLEGNACGSPYVRSRRLSPTFIQTAEMKAPRNLSELYAIPRVIEYLGARAFSQPAWSPCPKVSQSLWTLVVAGSE